MEDLSTLISDLDGLGLKTTLVRGKDFGWPIDHKLATDTPSKKWGRSNLCITKEAADLIKQKFGLDVFAGSPWKLPVSHNLEVRLFSERFNKGKAVGNIEFWFIGSIKFWEAVCICWSLSGDRVLWSTSTRVRHIIIHTPRGALSDMDGAMDRKLKGMEILSHRRTRTVERELAARLGSIVLNQ
jgi:hypothetical protein